MWKTIAVRLGSPGTSAVRSQVYGRFCRKDRTWGVGSMSNLDAIEMLKALGTDLLQAVDLRASRNPTIQFPLTSSCRLEVSSGTKNLRPQLELR